MASFGGAWLNMSQIELLLERFFSRNPDLREARNKGLVNRRALARYIAHQEKLGIDNLDALIMALRRYPSGPAAGKDVGRLFNQMKTGVKDSIAILSFRNSERVMEKMPEIMKLVGPNEAFRLVEGTLSIKLFVEKSRLEQIKSHFEPKDILETYNNIGEISVILSGEAIKTPGVVSYVTSRLAISRINIFEVLTSTPEMLIYVDNADLLRAYEVVKSL